MGHKRKREDQPTSITHNGDVVSDSKRAKIENASVSAAERRQIRSERKSKKAQAARDGASKTKSKSSKLASAPEVIKPETTAETDPMTADFIPLIEPPPVTAPKQHKSKDAVKAGKKDKRKEKSKNQDEVEARPEPTTSTSDLPPNGTHTKRASPRSLRKEAKAEKAQSALLAEYGSDAPKDTPKNANKIPVNNKDTPAQASRFICFVGNLPYDCTLEQLQTHFRALAPTQIRHSTNKATGKSKGFAFLEFDQYDKMKTCLKLYHHSIFDPERTAQLPDEAFDANGKEIKKGNSKRMKGRRINVELTAGGGGASENRKDKISKKNQKLNEERARRKLAEAKEAKKAEKKTAEQTADETPIRQDDTGIHPSRLKKMRQ